MGEHSTVREALLNAVHAERGHFFYESGHHGDLWMDLEVLFVDVRALQGWAAALAARLTTYRADLVCGPLTGGALLAQPVAAALGARFVFSERSVVDGRARYTLPMSLRPVVAGMRVVVVDDVINAGSAVGGTVATLTDAGATIVGVGALITMGPAAAALAAAHNAPCAALATLERGMWLPDECPLCRAGAPLVSRVAGVP